MPGLFMIASGMVVGYFAPDIFYDKAGLASYGGNVPAPSTGLKVVGAAAGGALVFGAITLLTRKR